MPACLPEQLLWIGVGLRPACISSRVALLADRPMRAAAKQTLVDARFGEQASHRREMLRVRRYASRTRRRARRRRGRRHRRHRSRPAEWLASDFTAERGKTGRLDIAEREAASLPSASAMAIAPRWRLSTRLPVSPRRDGFGFAADGYTGSICALVLPAASSIGTPVACFEARMTSEVFTLATFGAAVSSWMMKS